MIIKSGVLMVYYCFDVCEEIDVDRVKSILGSQAESSLLVCKKLTPPYIQYKKPAVLIRAERQRLRLKGREMEAAIDMKIYEFGIITIRISIPLRCRLADLVKINKLVVGNEEIRQAAESHLERIIGRIKDIMIKPNKNLDWEDYYIYSIDRVDGVDQKTDADKIISEYGGHIARILRNEDKLSRGEIEDALKYRLSYYGNDITLIDWNSAFIYDPTKSYDVPDVIEFATIQLLELRVYDSILDSVIEKAYDDISEKKRFEIFPLSSTIKKLSEIKLDISEMIDKLENYLKLIGDLYLAKIYAAASSRFYLDRWKSAVREKLNILESLYSKAWERSQTKRMVIAEIAITALFILDVILIFLELLK